MKSEDYAPENLVKALRLPAMVLYDYSADDGDLLRKCADTVEHMLTLIAEQKERNDINALNVQKAAELVAANADLQSRLDEALARIREAEGRWDKGRALQIDSFATGRPQAGMAYLIDNYVHVEITDGRSSFRGKIPLPKGWRP